MAGQRCSDDVGRRKSSFSRPAVAVKLTLQHRYSQQLFRRHYERLNHSLYVATKVLREENRDEEAKTNETAVLRLLKMFGEEVEGGLQSLTREMKAVSALTFAEVSFDQSKTFETSTSTSFSTRLLQLFSRFDELLVEVEKLELTCRISASESRELVRGWSGKFRTFLRALGQIRMPNRRASQESLSCQDSQGEREKVNAGS